jgi:photosystem II stability/assembly factor-like uncharacterized protein
MNTIAIIRIIFVFIFATSTPIFAQWTQTMGPYGDDIVCFAVSGNDIFAGTRNSVFLSTNNGTSWTEVNSGLTNDYIQSLAVSGTNIFAGTVNEGVFLSTNNGTSWTEVNSGLTNLYISSLGISGTNIFAGTNGGVFFPPTTGQAGQKSAQDCQTRTSILLSLQV